MQLFYRGHFQYVSGVLSGTVSRFYSKKTIKKKKRKKGANGLGYLTKCLKPKRDKYRGETNFKMEDPKVFPIIHQKIVRTY